jgi:hypothetical protein
MGLALAAGAGGAGLSACKKQPPPPPPPAAAPPAAAAPAAPPLPDIQCPPAETFASLGGPGRVLRTACVVFSPGRYWLGTALSYADKPAGKPAKPGKPGKPGAVGAGLDPRLYFLSGSPSSKVMLFDVQPLPVQAIEALIQDSKEVGVQIRRTRDDRSLVRLGITGSKGDATRPDVRELGLLLQLVAHKPPQILWVGAGDQTTTQGDCITEQTVDFEMLFRTRLERFAGGKSRPVPGGKAEACAGGGGPSMQETVAFQAVPLARGRILGEDAPPAPARP